jgi:hypothetical protein
VTDADRQEIAKLRWMLRQYEHFASWHSYIPTTTELEREYEEQLAAQQAQP